MLKIHTPPEGEIDNSLYEICIDGERADCFSSTVSAIPYNTVWPGCQRPVDQTEAAAILSFEADKTVCLSVRCLRCKASDIADVCVRPLSKNVAATLEDGIICFSLCEVGAYTLEINGFHNALHIFYNPVKDFSLEAQGRRNVVRFAPGVHDIGNIEVDEHTTVIVEAGAVVYGSVTAINAKDVKICGYGIIDGSKETRTDNTDLLLYDCDGELPHEKEELRRICEERQVLNGCIRLYRCTDSCVEGVILRDSASFALIPANCSNVTIDNIKTVGMWRYNSDGIDLFNCSDISVKNCFLRNFDDCMVIKGIAGWDSRNNENITVDGCVVWCDWGRALEYGAETNAPEYRNIVMRNCDVIHGSAVMLDIQHHNRAFIHDCLFENIRVEYSKYQLPEIYQKDMAKGYTGEPDTKHPVLIAIPIIDSGLFSKHRQNGSVRGIVFKDIRVLLDDGVAVPKSVFRGVDDLHTVSDISIENLTINGIPAAGYSEYIETNAFVHGILIAE